MTTIAVVNNSTVVSDSDVSLMCKAINVQVNSHFCPAWNRTGATVNFFAKGASVPASDWVLYLIDEDTDEEGALGFHIDDNETVDGITNVNPVAGFIMAKTILDNGGVSMLYNAANKTQYTVSATLSHEILETLADYTANLFAYVGGTLTQGKVKGNLVAVEVADPVEATNYPISIDGYQIAVSNFVLPSYFNPVATVAKNGKLDYLGQLTTPFSLAAGGYIIIGTIGNEGQITAERAYDDQVPEWRKQSKEKPFSRSSRRTNSK